MVINLSKTHALVSEWIGELRDLQLQADRMRFRRNLERIAEIAAFEISAKLEYENKEVQTPLGIATCKMLKEQPVVASILRAGLPMHNGLLNIFDKADSAFISA
jgi:uracil phosphoribosyltransferase